MDDRPSDRMSDQSAQRLTDEERIRRRDGLPTEEAKAIARAAIIAAREALKSGAAK